MNRRKKIALATLPALALLVLGSSVASAHMRPFALTEEERTAIEEARELRKEGDLEGARDALLEAGLDPHRRFAKMRHGMMHMHSGGGEKHAALIEAIENNDYAAFTRAIAGTPFGEALREDEFAILVKAHELRVAGDFEGAREILQDLPHPKRGERGW